MNHSLFKDCAANSMRAKVSDFSSLTVQSDFQISKKQQGGNDDE